MTFFLPTGARLRVRLSIVETKTVPASGCPQKQTNFSPLSAQDFKVGYETSVPDRATMTK